MDLLWVLGVVIVFILAVVMAAMASVIVESNGEQIGIYTPAWKPVDQPMKQAVSSEDDYGQARDDAERVRGGSLEVRRLDSRGEQGRIKGGQRAVEATLILARNERASEESGSRTKPAERQERALEDYAKSEGVWLDAKDIVRRGQVGKGREASVYRADDDSVYKLIDYKSVDKNTTPLDFIDHRIALYNHLFPATAYELVGFTRDGNGDFHFVVKQPFIRDAVYSTAAERQQYMQNKGLTMIGKYGEEFANEIYHVKDLHEKNALKTPDGSIVVIDAIPTAKYVGTLEVIESDRPMKQVTAKESKSFDNAKTIPARQLVQEVDSLRPFIVV